MQSLTEPSASIDATNGTLTFGALLISSGTTCMQLRTAYPDNKIRDMGNGYFWIYFSDIAVGDKTFYPSVCFDGDRLFMVDFWFKCKGEKIVTYEVIITRDGSTDDKSDDKYVPTGSSGGCNAGLGMGSLFGLALLAGLLRKEKTARK